MSKAGKLRVPDYLGHIVEAIRRIHLYVDDMSQVQFLEDAKTQDAVIRNFEIIGEACRNIDSHHPAFTQEHPEVPWGFAYEMRNALAHGYFKTVGWVKRCVTHRLDPSHRPRGFRRGAPLPRIRVLRP